ncbi:twin-arginine translocase TatA/TatE family subunit [Infirmifilum lucidum]|uniref:twin-arginine translocase TatA/TatE family subunit n=1 Tax=Infirmifilum lucidum TaxID=2776706 RepID=UPI001C3F9CE1|nr:twin-arginine translocase TatA/TatE family subunit [Infirmifilum lucidum]
MAISVSQHISVYSIGLGPTELLLLTLLAIILFAPRKLPELAKALKESADIIRREASGSAEKSSVEDKERALKEVAEKLEASEKQEKKKRRFF